MIINPTSHFIGLSLISDVLCGLFDRLALYIENNGIQDSVELQRYESLHITLYYLGENISDNEMLLYTQFSDSIPNTGIIMHSIEYFYRNDLPYILFVLPENREYYHQINRELALSFQRGDIMDNQFPYIPHITLMRILDSDVFVIHKEGIEKILQECIGEMRDTSLECTLNLYAVDSRIHPELQEQIL